eukprot:507689-Rhodomonas_salina.1
MPCHPRTKRTANAIDSAACCLVLCDTVLCARYLMSGTVIGARSTDVCEAGTVLRAVRYMEPGIVLRAAPKSGMVLHVGNGGTRRVVSTRVALPTCTPVAGTVAPTVLRIRPSTVRCTHTRIVLCTRPCTVLCAHPCTFLCTRPSTVLCTRCSTTALTVLCTRPSKSSARL